MRCIEPQRVSLPAPASSSPPKTILWLAAQLFKERAFWLA